jgi:hypothetical protein
MSCWHIFHSPIPRPPPPPPPQKPLIYSTGPLENQNGTAGGTIAQTCFVKILNNHHADSGRFVTANIYAFRLDGTKTLIFKTSLTVRPASSQFARVDVSTSLEYEIEIEILPAESGKDVLVAVFPKDASGALVAAQREVSSELTRIEHLTFGSMPPTTKVTI